MVLDLAKNRSAIRLPIAKNQGSCLFSILPLAQKEEHFGAFPWFQLHLRLKRGTGIQSGSDLS
jgi:hypothetical protein